MKTTAISISGISLAFTSTFFLAGIIVSAQEGNLDEGKKEQITINLLDSEGNRVTEIVEVAPSVSDAMELQGLDAFKERFRHLDNRRENNVLFLALELPESRDLQRSLEIVDAQKKDLVKAKKIHTSTVDAINSEIRPKLKKLMKKDQDERLKKEVAALEDEARRRAKSANKLYKDEVYDILLPYQQELLRGMASVRAFEFVIGSTGRQNDRLIWPLYVATSMELSDSEIAKVRDAIKTSRENLGKKIREANEDALQHIVDSFPPNLKEYMKELVELK